MNLAEAKRWGTKELERLERKARVIRDRLKSPATTHLTGADLSELIEAQEAMKALLGPPARPTRVRKHKENQ